MSGDERKQRTRYCDRHPNRKASHFCQACDADRCVHCVFEAEEHRGITDDFRARCSKCGGYVQTIRIHRSDNKSYFARILSAPLYPLSASGFTMLLATTLFIYLLQFILCFGVLLGQAVLWSVFFGLLRQSALGSDSPDVPEFSSVWDDLLVPLGRGIAATALLWVPAAIYLYWRLTHLIDVETDRDVLLRLLFLDPILWLIILAGFAYMPMALIIAGLGGNVLEMLNPVRIVAYAWRTMGDYLIAVAATLAIGVAWALLGEVVGDRVKDAGIPFISGLVATLLSVYPLFVAARVLGLLAFVRGESYDYGASDEYLEPAVAGARPAGKPGSGIRDRPVGDASAAGSHHHGLPFEGQTAEVPVSAASFATASAVEATSHSTAWPAETPLEAGQAIMAALELRDVQGALSLYREAVAGGLGLVEPPVHLEVGRSAAGAGDMRLSHAAFEAAATLDPTHEVVPRAMVLLARLCGQRFGNVDRATELYREVVRRFPGTPAAGFASKQLEQQVPE